jgi:hypothetical protein
MWRHFPGTEGALRPRGTDTSVRMAAGFAVSAWAIASYWRANTITPPRRSLSDRPPLLLLHRYNAKRRHWRRTKIGL